MKRFVSSKQAWAWVALGTALSACGLFTSGTESGNPSFEENAPPLPDNVPLPAHSLEIPQLTSSSGTSNTGGGIDQVIEPGPTQSAPPKPASSDAVADAANSPPPVATSSAPPISSPGTVPPQTGPGTQPAPPSAGAAGAANCSPDSCRVAADQDAQRLGAASSVVVPSYNAGSCDLQGAFPICRCRADGGEVLNVGSATECALKGRFECLIAQFDAAACSAAPVDASVSALDCSATCVTAAALLQKDVQKTYSVVAAGAVCSAAICRYTLRVDGKTCFQQPGLQALTCP